MGNYFEEVEDWIAQVEDENTSVDDYDFLDQLHHGGPQRNGSNGLANVGAYLAIYEEDGETKIDEDLVEELDRRQNTERSNRERFRNIVYDAQTEKREGKTLKDRGVDGHERIQKMIDEFRSNANIDSRGDPYMTEDNEENNYEKAIEKLDTVGGYALAAITGPINVPATILGVGAKYAESDEPHGGTEINIHRKEDKNDTISSNSGADQGGETTMTEDADYDFQAQGGKVLEEDDEFYEFFDEGPGYVQEAAGIAQEVILAEAGESEYGMDELAEYAVKEGMEEEVGAIKARLVMEESGMEDLYDEFVEQVYDRASDIVTASWMQEQLQELTRGMSKGTRRAAAAHEQTESAFDYGRDTADDSADAVMATLQNLEAARRHKGLEDVPEELEDEETTEE